MPEMVHRFEGSCHCEAIGFELRSTLVAEAWSLRACQCSFCRGHGANMTSDPRGSVRFVIKDAAQLGRYRFGLHTADFFVCRRCGVYIAAVTTTGKGSFATLNANVIRPAIELRLAAPMSYDGESPAQRLTRREQRWTPVVDD